MNNEKIIVSTNDFQVNTIVIHGAVMTHVIIINNIFWKPLNFIIINERAGLKEFWKLFRTFMFGLFGKFNNK